MLFLRNDALNVLLQNLYQSLETTAAVYFHGLKFICVLKECHMLYELVCTLDGRSNFVIYKSK
jgi:hypothetical protein